MLQRKQTLFLLLSVILYSITYYFPYGQYGSNLLLSYRAVDSNNTMISGISTYYFAIPLSIAATITLISIFLYGNRQRQMGTVRLTFIFFAVSFVLLSLYMMKAQNAFPDESIKPGISFFLPFGSFFLNMFALRAIRKDDQLVKSVDRIR